MVSTSCRTTSLAIVLATWVLKIRNAAKLKNAAHATAYCGFSTRVDTTVAIEFAASWKPFMKSNASASAISSTSTWKLIAARSPTLRPLEQDALDHVRDVLAAVGHALEQLVELLHLDDAHRIALVGEKTCERRAHHLVGFALEAVDLLAE